MAFLAFHSAKVCIWPNFFSVVDQDIFGQIVCRHYFSDGRTETIVGRLKSLPFRCGAQLCFVRVAPRIALFNAPVHRTDRKI